MRRPGPLGIMVACCAVVAAWSAVRPWSYDVWAFEIAPGLVGVAALLATRRCFPFSTLTYVLVGVHFVVLAVAAKYTYAEMPLFNWLRDALSLARNHYDRVGHFFQGFVPAIVAREVLIRTGTVRRGKLLPVIVASFCLAVSAFWELLEWWVVVLFYPKSGPEWLGMQGDPWDAQWDMFMALVGAVSALALLSWLHDRSMARLEGPPAAKGAPAEEVEAR